MRITLDPKNPPKRETLSPGELRQRIADRLIVMSDVEFRNLCDDTGITAAAFFDRNRCDVKQNADGTYELTTYHVAEAEAKAAQ
jgi:hypothetical protein